MAVVGPASSYVYTGVWTNWSKGKYIGLTLTLSPTTGLLLIALLAIFIQLAGTQLWRILQYFLHQFRATSEPMDGLYHQQQVIMRNSSSELSALWSMLRVAIAWRKEKTAKSYQRSAPLMLLTLLHFSFWALAGVFSSQILSAGDPVLSRSPFCGVYNTTYLDLVRQADPSVVVKPSHLYNEFFAKGQQRYQESQQYVQFCSDGETACRELQHKKIPWDWNVEPGCPFEPRVCSQTINKSVVVDTGLISSHRHLGLNTPEKDRIQYRKVTTCSILNDAEYISDWRDIPATSDSPAKRVVDAYYGYNPFADRNSTYTYSEWQQYYSYDQYSNTNPYQMNVQMADASDPTGRYSDFIPVSELKRTDADIYIAFLSFSKVYEKPVNDPWFSARQMTVYPARGNKEAVKVNGTFYKRERPVTTLACAEQHQLCIDSDHPAMRPDSEKCTPLAGSYATAIGVDSFNLTAHQVAVATRVLTAAQEASFFNVLIYLNQRDSPLLARRQIQGLVGLQLPENQWQKEILYWNSIALTHLQRSVVDYSTGTFAADTSYINNTQTPWSQWLCENQTIGGTGYQSFNLFTIILIVSVGSFIVGAGLVLEVCVALLRRRPWARKSGEKHDKSNARRDMWVLNDVLEMLRMVYATNGGVAWTSGSFDIPIARDRQTMTIRGLSMDLHCTKGHLEKGGSNHELEPATETYERLPHETSITPNSENISRLSHDANAQEAISVDVDPTTGAENRLLWDHLFHSYDRARRGESWLSDDSDGLLRPPPLAPVWPPALSYGRGL